MNVPTMQSPRVPSDFRFFLFVAVAFALTFTSTIPLFAQSAAARSEVRLEPSGDTGEDDLFGGQVAMSGNTLVISGQGADGATIPDEGAVFVFERSNNAWVQTARLVPTDARTRDDFGDNVGINEAGNIIAIAADQQSISVHQQGVVYVFEKVDGTWVQRAELASPTPGNNAGFGFFGMAISGNSIAVGDPGGPLNGFTATIDVFTRTDAGWQLSAQISVDDNFAFFPQSISMSGNLLVASSLDPTISDGGAAYVFALEDGVWKRQATIVPDDPQFGSQFGTSVSLSGDLIAVGAPFATGATFLSGEAYVFGRTGNTWTQQARLASADGAQGDLFGGSVAVNGATVVVGSPFHRTTAGVQSGSAYVYHRNSNQWTLTTQLTPSDGVDFGDFGSAVAVLGDTALIGAIGQHPQQETASGYPGGEAYVDRLHD